MSIPNDVLQTLPPTPYAELADHVRTGDLIFASGTQSFSRLIRWATGSPWSHVAVVVRIDALERVMVAEAVEKIGVRLVPIHTFLSADSAGRKPFPGKLLLARHAEFEAKGDAAALQRLARFAFDRLGSPFGAGEILRIALRIVAGKLARPMPGVLNPHDEFICSEYVAKCFEAVGIRIPWDGMGFIAPGDLAQAPPVHAVAQIAPE